jgi:indole-3-glycerol phosphate synthase/phosphoribosylanthranilate isomerase
MREPNGVLGEIVACKRRDVAARLGGCSIEGLRALAPPTSRSLKAALRRPGARFIMEVKRASPSGGALRRDADPAAIASAYRGATDAISVLTDEPYFGGSLTDLAAVRAAYDGPILAKDFMIDSRQVAEARRHGADAILIMLSVLDDAEAGEMIAEARRLGMDALVEAHDEAEVRRAVALGAELIGINNRDLRTLEVDLGVTERLARLVPADRILVAESGISTRAEVHRLAPYANAFLVGSALMRADDPARAARQLAFGRVKVCGIKRLEDLTAAHRSGASYAGLIFVPGTPRAVSLREAERLAEAAEMPLVGVFRDEAIEAVAVLAHRCRLAAVQLHGRETPAYATSLRPLLPEGCEIWAAEGVGAAPSEKRLGADRALFDTAVNGRSGGTGIAFDWQRVASRPELRNGLLAGGLGPGNAAAAARTGAWALDVCSGVEAAPGRKCPDKLAAFFDALRPSARGEAATC